MRPKFATTLTRLVAVATVAALSAGISPALATAKPAAAKPAAAKPAPATTAPAKAAPAKPAPTKPAAKTSQLDRKNVIRRARTWTNAKVRYSQTGWRGGYRRDCSGFVSMAWSLPENLVTWRIPLVAKRIGKRDLRPGDVLLNYTGAGGAKHVIIFEAWADRKHTAYIGLEQTGAAGVDRAIRRKIPYPYFTSKGRYKPWRYTGMNRYWKAIPRKQRQPVHGYRGPIKSPEALKALAQAQAKAVAAKKAEALAKKKAAEAAERKKLADTLAKSRAEQAAKEAAHALVAPAPEKPSDKLDMAVTEAGQRTDALIVQVLATLQLVPEAAPSK